MNELSKEQSLEQNSEQSFEDMLTGTMVIVRNGDIVKGTVISIHNNEVIVNLGYKSDGIIERGQFSDDPNVNVEELIKPGDEIEAFVVRVNDGDGNVILSRKRAGEKKGYAEVEAAFANGGTVKGKITGTTKGGVTAGINGVRAFVPSSQLDSFPVKDLDAYIGKSFNFNIIKLEKGKRGGVVAGRRDLAAKEAQALKDGAFERLNVGDRVQGVVRRIVEFGAFVDLGGVDGLIHISQLSFGRVKDVKEVLSEGDEVVVTVTGVDKEKGKISLSYKDMSKDPWNGIADKYPVNEVVEGKVVRFAKFGAFVELEPGIDGLVHISQIADVRVDKPENYLTIGETVSVRVMGIDNAKREINLSIKETFERRAEDIEDIEDIEEDAVEEDVAEKVFEKIAENVEVAEDVTEEVAEVEAEVETTTAVEAEE
jgi:4-hydroxy-3-methylbut-2-enyl diphosphate reductase